MAQSTAIEWADRTWSPWIGCQKVGPGCDHCYAEALNKRTGGGNWGPGAPRRRTSAAYWRQPRKWNAAGPSTVFPSLCDPFDNAVDPRWRQDFACEITFTPNLTWLLVTKRIGNAASMLAEMFPAGPPVNLWLGATIVDQTEADRDIPKLLTTPAAKRFLSMEPLLGPVDLTHLRQGTGEGQGPWAGMTIHLNVDGLRGAKSIGWPALDWVIVGGESGHGARPMHPDWVRSLRDQCATAGVPFLFKQWGEWAPMDAAGIGSDRPITDRWENIRDRMSRYITALDETWGRRVRGHSFTEHATNLVYQVGKKAAGRSLDGVQHDGVPA